MTHTLDWKAYAKTARKAVAEGCVMVRNEENVLPIKKGTKLAIFGRMQFHYIKSGTGSGGLVNAPYVTSVLEELMDSGYVHINEELLHTYEEWVEANPFDRGKGWAQEPWAQVEMNLTDEVVAKAAEQSETALVVMGRLAGEDRDNTKDSGSYLLQQEEERMLELTTKYFKKVVVILNVGNIMDMKWVEQYQPQSVLYIWQGGSEGGAGAVDVLLGKCSPSGKLADTIAYDIGDYPSTKNFGNATDNIYQEDIYVGYRYFETFAKDKVMYPFGYGLSYTSFSLKNVKVECEEIGLVRVQVEVENIGDVAGKEVVQLYLNPAQGLLGKPLRNLVGFQKTKTLQPGESQLLSISLDLNEFASYDDSGVTGYPYSYVLEAGTYELYLGTDVRSAERVWTTELEQLQVVEQLSQACAPVQAFTRIKPSIENNQVVATMETVPLREKNYAFFAENKELKSTIYTGDRGYKLQDVKDGKIELDTFIAQLSDEELIYMTRGEGMCSPKVTPGTAGAIGGVTEGLQEKGIPLACCSDGPSGMRLDSGAMAYSLPNGATLASTYNMELNEELFGFLGLEMRLNAVDTLLGPGINIHRNPLNGRNFEYFSEDPYVTGMTTIAQLKALHRLQLTGTIKHFACNNQEYERSNSNSVVSERALREIYLKGFEMAVKKAGAYSIMSTYGSLNGLWTASNYDLLTTILRNEWGYEGIVMTDWWAKMNEEGGEASITHTASMIKSQNDVYMVTECAEKNTLQDESPEALKDGRLNRALLERSGKNICKFLMKSPCLDTLNQKTRIIIEEIDPYEMKEIRCTLLPELQSVDGFQIIDCTGLDTSKAASAKIFIHEAGTYAVDLTVSADIVGIAQVPVTLYCGSKAINMLTLNKEKCNHVTMHVSDLQIKIDHKQYNYIKLFFAEGGMRIEELKITAMP